MFVNLLFALFGAAIVPGASLWGWCSQTFPIMDFDCSRLKKSDFLPQMAFLSPVSDSGSRPAGSVSTVRKLQYELDEGVRPAKTWTEERIKTCRI